MFSKKTEASPKQVTRERAARGDTQNIPENSLQNLSVAEIGSRFSSRAAEWTQEGKSIGVGCDIWNRAAWEAARPASRCFPDAGFGAAASFSIITSLNCPFSAPV